MTARIDNPNRIGSGFINLGPQQRNEVTAAANWQTSGLLGGGGAAAAPQTVSDIWSSTPAPMQPQQQRQPFQQPPQPQPQMQPFAAPAAPFAPAPAAPVRDVNAIFSSLNLDAPPPPQQLGQPPKPPTPYLGAGAPGASAYATGIGLSANALQQPFMNGGVAPQAAPGMVAAPQQSLMTLLQQQAQAQPAPTVSAPSLAPVYGGLGSATMANASMADANRMAAFSNSTPATPQCQLPPNGQLPSNGCNHVAAFASAAFAPSTSRQAPPPPRAPPGPPKTLSSAADYAVAAQHYKPPPTAAAPSGARSAAPTTTGLGRKPELSKPTPASGAAAVEKEWECSRCTFLNNSSLWECEMCGFERPGKAAVADALSLGSGRGSAAVAADNNDDGWKSAGGSSARKAATNDPGALAAAGKSKAQSKNEKRRAKKRGD